MLNFSPNQYARIVGQHRQIPQKNGAPRDSFIIERIAVISNYDVVTNHLLTTALFSEMRRKGMIMELHEGKKRVG